jgi:hypothetical protein
VQQTKQEAEVNVLLANSLHSYPRTLENLGIHKGTIQFDMSEELTPPSMSSLLDILSQCLCWPHLFLSNCLHHHCMMKEEFVAIYMISDLEGGGNDFCALLKMFGSSKYIAIYQKLADRGWIKRDDDAGNTEFYDLIMNDMNLLAYTVSRRHRGLNGQKNV